MHTKKGHVETLDQLGLTPSQARIYLAIIKTGITRVKKISEITNIARPHVYEAVNGLEKVGLIEKTMDEPATLKTIPLDDGIKLLLARREKETLKLTHGIDRLLQDHEKNRQMTDLQDPRNQFVWLRKKNPYIQKRVMEIENSKVSIEFITSLERFPVTVLTFYEMAKKALDRGVKIRVIISNEFSKQFTIPKYCKGLMNSSNYQLKHVQDSSLVVLAIFDRKVIIVDADPKLNLGEVPALWTNNPSFLLFASNYFESLWKKAKPVLEIVKLNVSG